MDKKEIKMLYFHILKKDELNFQIEGISEDKILWHNLPTEFQDLRVHDILLAKSAIMNVMKAIKPINGYRKIGLKMDQDLKNEYFDDDTNLCYKGIPLEEITSVNVNKEEMKLEDSENKLEQHEENFLHFSLISKILELEKKLENTGVQLQNIEKKFVLDKFDKKLNAEEWLRQFNAECFRHNLNKTDSQIIEALRYFVTGSSKDWYEANLKKIGLCNWKSWQQSFLTVFIEKGWTNIRKAYSFKHIGGSLVDYALAKEKLCLEAENNSTTLTRIHMIVVGLPLKVQDKLDKEELTTIEKLFVALRKLDDSFSNCKIDTGNVFPGPSNSIKVFRGKKHYEEQEKKLINNNIQRKPCFHCEKLGWQNRFHQSSECRNKNQVNLNEMVNDVVNDTQEVAEMLTINLDQKN